MSDLTIHSNPRAIPAPREAIEIIPATPGDVAWIDSLQKKHRDNLGFQPFGAIEGKIAAGEIIIARNSSGVRIGYCMASDRYMKHEDVGVVYQMNVEPGYQRGFVGAALLKTQFERSAYGCKLYCCWCAQDLDGANRFWEAMGFVPLAYRAGSEKKARVHIFWQKRIREGDSATNWWFPSETKGGSMDDRLVFPVPAGKHWSDEMPVIVRPGDRPQLEGPESAKPRRAKANPKVPVVPTKPMPLSGGLSFAAPMTLVSTEPEKKPREKKVKAKNDPKLVAAARELKDRWLEHVNTGGALIEAAGKYDVSRILPSSSAPKLPNSQAKLLPAA